MPAPFDIIILGGGIAGFTAGLYAARDRRDTLLIERFSAGGQVLNCEHIENYPGFPDGIAGYKLGPEVQQQATNSGLKMKIATVNALNHEGDIFSVDTDEETFQARTVIIATGSRFSTLGIPGEKQFVGKGVSHCAACDGSFFIDKPVVVVGGGDAALDEALHLTQYASHVTIVHRRDSLRACQILQERARANNKIAFRWDTKVNAIEGSDMVTHVQTENLRSGAQEEMAAAGIFPYIGLTPNTEFLGDLAPYDENGHIVTDLQMRTTVTGLLAAGDVRKDSARQLVSSAGDGATAALAGIRYLRSNEWQS